MESGDSTGLPTWDDIELENETDPLARLTRTDEGQSEPSVVIRTTVTELLNFDELSERPAIAPFTDAFDDVPIRPRPARAVVTTRRGDTTFDIERGELTRGNLLALVLGLVVAFCVLGASLWARRAPEVESAPPPHLPIVEAPVPESPAVDPTPPQRAIAPPEPPHAAPPNDPPRVTSQPRPKGPPSAPRHSDLLEEHFGRSPQ